MTNAENSINYIEFPMTDVEATIAFYERVFGWSFQRWGENYISFNGAVVEGGFDLAGAKPTAPGPLIILYTNTLEAKREQVIEAGGEIVAEIYAFPGGRRFHFRDPNGNVLAVWSEKE